MAKNLLGGAPEKYVYTGGHCSNYLGHGNATAEGIKYMLGGKKRARDSEAFSEQFSDPTGNFGIMYLEPKGPNGEPSLTRSFVRNSR